MADEDVKDLKQHINSSHDFYALLDVSEGAQETEIRRAYRKTALKYHPDKVGANPEALDKFHLLQIAYDVLSDPTVKELYDNARRARQQKLERDKAFEGRRKWMKEDLERRESGVFKRKREESEAEEEFERELRRLAEDGKRRRKEREEQLRQEARQMAKEDESVHEDGTATNCYSRSGANGQVPDLDRSVTLRFPQNETTVHIDRAEVISRFECFGNVEEAILRDKKIRIEGGKHKQPYMTAVLVYKSVVGAHAAVSDFPKLAQQDAKLSMFEAVGWAAGKEPDCIPKAPDAAPMTPRTKLDNLKAASNTPSFQNGDTIDGPGLKKVPSFGSFKGTPRTQAQSSPSLHETMMMRLKNAERRKAEERRIREEEAAATTQGVELPE